MSDIIVHIITEDSDPMVDVLCELAETNFDPTLQCSPGFKWPRRGTFTKNFGSGGKLFYSTDEDDNPLGFAIVSPEGRVAWLALWGDTASEVVRIMGQAIKDKVAPPGGKVRSGGARQIILDSTIFEDAAGQEMRWSE